MNKNYDQLLRNVKNRTNPEGINESVLLSKTFSDELRDIGNRKVLEYVRRSMHGVEPNYTQKTIEAGNNVKKHLKDVDSSLDFKFQGSVMTNTHIKGHSDIDLVQICNTFYRHESMSKFRGEYDNPFRTQFQKNRLSSILTSVSFSGNAENTLSSVREKAEKKLCSIYLDVNIDKAKSIEVKPTYPSRTIDVVTASWYKSLNSVLENDDNLRGIEIYDKHKNHRMPVDYPFLKINLLNEQDKKVNGRLKKMIRFLKSVKADSDNKDQISLSSFDISSICSFIPAYKYEDKPYFELVEVLYNELHKIVMNESYRNEVTSILKTEFIFRGKPNKLQGTILLYRELNSVYEDLTANLPLKRFL